MILILLNVLIIFHIWNVGANNKGSTHISSRLYRKTGIGRWLFGKVFYDVDPYLTKDGLVAVRYALRYMNSLTCVKWIQKAPWDDDIINYVSFFRYKDSKNRPLCGSRVEMVGRKQVIYIGDWCFAIRDDLKRKSTLLHEMMHVMGFLHEIQRPDRDCFLFINEQFKKYADYAKVLPAYTFEYESPYDYQSIMQYESIDNRYMHALDYQKLGRHDGKLSSIDIIKVNHVYCGGLSFCELYPMACEIHKQLKARYGCVD